MGIVRYIAKRTPRGWTVEERRTNNYLFIDGDRVVGVVVFALAVLVIADVARWALS